MRSASFAALLLLTGCVSMPERQVDALHEAARADYLATHGQWAFTGRIAYSHAGKGGSAQIRWQQDGESSDVRITAPLAMGSVHIRFDPRQAQILDGSGQSLKVGPPEALLAELLQLPAPLPDLTQGLRANWPDTPEQTAMAVGGAVTIADWTWQYADWRDEPVRLPGKIEIQRGQTRLRLVIDQWLELPRD